MKKIAFATLLLLAFCFTHAQNNTKSGNPVVDKPVDFEAGLSFCHPIKFFGMTSSFGMGVDAAVTHKIWNGLSAGVRGNYMYCLGKKDEFNGGHYAARNLFGFFAEANYQLPNKLVFGVDLGLSVITAAGESEKSFGQKFYAGYAWDGWIHPIVFAFFYEQTDFQKNLGLRADIRL